MGRRLNVSTPTVINTELVPLDESFYLDVDGQMEQWYYDNTEQYAPNRKVTPLLLVPVISVFDKDTSMSYSPTFQTAQWFANEWDESQGKYVETEIINQVDTGSADYVIQGNNLLVKKNVSYSHAVSIRCVATYIDPRDSGVTYAVEDSVNLTTNRTADVVFPEVDIISPSGRAYNPLVDDTNSQYEFKGVTTNNPVQPLNTDVRRYSVDVDGTEEILNSGEAIAPIMDIRYGENRMTDQEFMYRQTAGGTLVGESIDKAYIERIKGNTVAWNQGGSLVNASAYSPEKAQVTISSGVLKCKCLEASDYGYLRGFVVTNPKPVIGHVYILLLDIKSEIDRGYVFSSYGTDGSLTTDKPTFVANTWQKYSSIYVSTTEEPSFILRVNLQPEIGEEFYAKNFLIFDLTLIYGAGNESSTVAQFEADYERWFGKPLSYEEYDKGSLRPVLMQSVKTTGFNQWNEEWLNGYYDENGNVVSGDTSALRAKNLITVLPNTTYFWHKPHIGRIYYFTGDDVFISRTNSFNVDGTFTTPSNCYKIGFNIFSGSAGYTYNHDICINISNPSKNGTYEPYEEKVQGFDVTAIKGKLNGAGNSVAIFPDGMKKAGNIQDEIFVEDGVVKAVKRDGSVDLGSLTWSAIASSDYPNRFRANLSLKGSGNNTTSKYVNKGVGGYGSDISMDKSFNTDSIGSVIQLHDSAYSDAATFKAAMQGVMLYYELATPEIYVLDPITDFVWYGIKNGQEVLADTLPWYVSGQGTDNLTVDAMYGENINVVLRCKMMDGETLSPSKAYATLSWRIPDIETFVQSDNGGAVRSDTEDMTFDTIVNVNGDVLTDALKQKHLAFNWKIRKNNTSTEIDKGWGQRITIDASNLRNVKQTPSSTLASTIVGNVVYLKGAYEEVTDNGEVITDGGEVVYDRPVD